MNLMAISPSNAQIMEPVIQCALM